MNCPTAARIFCQYHPRRQRLPYCTIEVLIPDFKGNLAALKEVMDACPEILNHNTETVPRLYRTVRPQANYQQTLQVLSNAKILDPDTVTKSGIMVGLGETKEEVLAVMQELREHGLDILTIGQYLTFPPICRFTLCPSDRISRVP
jgi:lipoic acid synthetase